MNPQDAGLLSQLRDIHGAPEAPWWPPAPGWWILAGIAILVLFMILRRIRAAYRIRQRKNRLLGLLDTMGGDVDPGTNPQAYVSSLNRILKIVAIRAFPGEHCAALQGDSWTRFVGEKLAENADAAHLAVLSSGPYEPVPAFDAAALDCLARDWIRKYG